MSGYLCVYYDRDTEMLGWSIVSAEKGYLTAWVEMLPSVRLEFIGLLRMVGESPLNPGFEPDWGEIEWEDA